MDIDAKKTYLITGEALATIVRRLDDFPIRQLPIVEAIKVAMLSGLKELPIEKEQPNHA